MSPGDEIIVVIPAPRPESRADTAVIIESRRVIDKYKRLFSKVIAETVSNFPGDRTLIVSNAIDERHTFLREDIKYFQFECRAANYPLREQLESESFVMRAIDHNWNQGAGVNLSVCGYSIRQSVQCN